MSDHSQDLAKGDQAKRDQEFDFSGAGEPIDAPGIAPDDGETSSQSRKIVSKLMIMAPAHPDQNDHRAKNRSEDQSEDSSKDQSREQSKDWDRIRIDPVAAAAQDSRSGSGRKTSAIIAVAVVAGIAGAIGTAMATAGFAYFTSKPDPTVAANHARALDESMTRIEQDLTALRNNVDRVAKASASQAGKTADRLDRIEKAQAEPAAKLAKLTDTVEKLRVAAATPPAPPAPAPAAAAPPPPAPVASAPAKEVTGSITPKKDEPAQTKPDVARLPTLDGWVLLGAGNGSATIEGRPGIFDVFAGDPVPGLGRIDAIRRQDGRWVVVTSKGLIVAR